MTLTDEDRSAINQAFVSKNLAEVRRLVNRENVDEMISAGRTVVQMACQTTKDILRHVVSVGGNLQEQGESGESLLHTATEFGNGSIMRYLISKGLSPDDTDDEMMTPLHVACQDCNFKVVKILVDAGGNVNAQSDEGETPLHFACNYTRPDSEESNGSRANDTDYDDVVSIVRYLLDHGADRHIKAHDLEPIDIARENGLSIVVQLLDDVSLYDLLEDGDAAVSPETEYIGSDVSPLDSQNSTNAEIKKRTGEFFYDVKDVAKDGKIIRIFERSLLDKLRQTPRRAKNPFTNNAWSVEDPETLKAQLKKVVFRGRRRGRTQTEAQAQSQATSKSKANDRTQTKPQSQSAPKKKTRLQGGTPSDKQYVMHNNRKYLVRTGKKGGKYILVGETKIYQHK